MIDDRAGFFVSYNKELVLNEVIFNALKVAIGERDAVYEAVTDLVTKRLQKAGTI